MYEIIQIILDLVNIFMLFLAFGNISQRYTFFDTGISLRFGGI